jgi:hypothetical protein
MGGCAHLVPTNPSQELLRLIKTYKAMPSVQRGEITKEAGLTESQICWEIKRIMARQEHVEMALLHDWPINPNFSRLTERVLSLEADLRQLVLSEDARSKTPVYRRLETVLFKHKWTLNRLATARLPPSIIADESRPG